MPVPVFRVVHPGRSALRGSGGGAGRAGDLVQDVVLRDAVPGAASAAIWPASTARMRSAFSVPRPSDAAIDRGVRISAHHHRPVRQRSTRETGSVGVRGSTRTEWRSRPASRSSTARAPISRRIPCSPRPARTWLQRGTTSSPAAIPMAPSSRAAMRHVEVGRAMAMVEPWWGITTAAAEAEAIPGILPIRRAGARRRRCAPRLATDSSTASPRTRLDPEEGLTAFPAAPDNCAGLDNPGSFRENAMRQLFPLRRPLSSGVALLVALGVLQVVVAGDTSPSMSAAARVSRLAQNVERAESVRAVKRAPGNVRAGTRSSGCGPTWRRCSPTTPSCRTARTTSKDVRRSRSISSPRSARARMA